MAANLSKKFSLLMSCLMTMQALRLVISTAGFCAVRFHIDCSLFGIFISRLVNAVLMSQLFGNWLGDLIVFAASGQVKLVGLMLANWTEFSCFCSALFCICHTECGHLTGFYWSMVSAYFWWKVGEAPTVSIAAPDATDYYFAGFTLSGVWAACLKGLVMRCVAGDTMTLSFHSDALGDVNVKLVGARSVKTTVDYRAAKWLYVITIVLTALMCMPWSLVSIVVTKDNSKPMVANALKAEFDKAIDLKAVREKEATANSNKLLSAIQGLGNQSSRSGSGEGGANFTTANNLEKTNVSTSTDKVTISLSDVSGGNDGTVDIFKSGALVGIVLDMTGGARWNSSGTQIEFAVKDAGVLEEEANMGVATLAGIAFGGVLAVPGAMLGVGVVWLFGKCCCLGQKKCQLIFGIVGALGGFATGLGVCVADANGQLGKTEDWQLRMWVEALKWPAAGTEENVKWAPMYGLLAGMMVGLMVGVIVACCKPRLGGSPLPAGAFFGSFFGLICGEIVNGAARQDKGPADAGVVVCGFLIVVVGLGTVYSIYPGMAPCSITQFKYFNIIDILILILSSIAPLVIMGLDLGDDKDRLANAILEDVNTRLPHAHWMWAGIGFILTIATLICEGIVISIMQHPFSKTAQQVTSSGWRAVLLTVTMVTSQLVSTGIGFGCVAAGGRFNDGINNAHSTLTLWTTECCGVLGEGYMTELKKYEPGKWPTQGMGKWESHKWWRNKAFGNAWEIWKHICTKDLRRDIMLCRQ